MDTPYNVAENRDLREREHVFRDRTHAGEILADMLRHDRVGDELVLAIPAGGVPVAIAAARRLELSLDTAVVSKIVVPWNTDLSIGAVAFDGTVALNDQMISVLSIGRGDVEAGIAATREKVARRKRLLRPNRPPLGVNERTVILVDEGLASGFTVRVAAEVLVGLGAREVLVAVPTAHLAALERLSSHVDRIYCSNIRSGARFAVADAYQAFDEVSEDEAAADLRAARSEGSSFLNM